MDQNLKNWMLTGTIFLAHATAFLVAAGIFSSRTDGERGPAAEGVMILLATLTVATAVTGALIVLVTAGLAETRQRAAATQSISPAGPGRDMEAEPGPEGRHPGVG